MAKGPDQLELREFRKLLEGKHSLVTGGANGIGRAIVIDLLNNGSSVTVWDNDKRGLSKLADELRDSSLSTHYIDITNQGSLSENVLKLPDVDILINNAGGGKSYDVTYPDEEIWNQVIALNLHAQHAVTSLIIPPMIERKSGSIIFITSIHAIDAYRHSGPYDMAKSGLVGYMRSLALDLAEYGIRVNAVAPGGILQAGGTVHLSTEKKIELASQVPLKRLGLPEDIANSVTFLVSDFASYITGQQLVVDGGLTITNPHS